MNEVVAELLGVAARFLTTLNAGDVVQMVVLACCQTTGNRRGHGDGADAPVEVVTHPPGQAFAVGPALGGTEQAMLDVTEQGFLVFLVRLFLLGLAKTAGGRQALLVAEVNRLAIRVGDTGELVTAGVAAFDSLDVGLAVCRRAGCCGRAS